MEYFRSGLGRVADRMIRALAQEFHEQHAFSNIAIIRVDTETTIARGLATNRLSAQGVTKQMVGIARSELRRLGHILTFEAVDEMLMHAERHRSGACVCRCEHIGGTPAQTGGEKQMGIRARRLAAGVCVRCASPEADRGVHCRPCAATLVAMRREARARKRMGCGHTVAEIEEIDF
jgi:hypothetical protein